jgi:hypothetical protein
MATAVAYVARAGYGSRMDASNRWVLLAYRLPREPSTPRITLWRKLRRAGAVQVLDSLAALPLTARTQEQFEWLAEEVIEAGGEASVWVASPRSAAEERELTGRLAAASAEDYQAVIAAAEVALREPSLARRRTLNRLRRELRRINDRDYTSPPERNGAQTAVAAFAATVEVSA